MLRFLEKTEIVRRQLGKGTRINGMGRNDEKGKGRTEGGADASFAMQLEVMQGPCNPENERVQGNGAFSEGMSVIWSLCEMEVFLKEWSVGLSCLECRMLNVIENRDRFVRLPNRKCFLLKGGWGCCC